MTNWVLTHCVGSVRKVSFKFPENFIVKSKQRVKLWAGNKNSITTNNNTKKYNDLSISTNNTNLTSSTLCKSPTLNGKNTHNVSKMNGHHHLTNGNHTNNSHNNTKESLSPLLSFSTDINTSLSDINECIENELILYRFIKTFNQKKINKMYLIHIKYLNTKYSILFFKTNLKFNKKKKCLFIFQIK